MNFAVPTDYRGKLKESKKSDKYLDIVKELKKLCNIKVTVIPFVIGAVPKGLIKGLKDFSR